jgi:rubredoxin-NAD+ reductase
MNMPRPLVIVGTGLAGYTLAREWRKLDRERPLVMISRDDGAFYSKPMLSNALAQQKTPETLVVKPAAAMGADLEAEIRTGAEVSAIDPGAGTLTCDGEEIRYGDLVLATGAMPIHVPVAGDGGDDVIAVNNLGDYARFRRRLDGAERVAIMGPGLIGCEFANDLCSRGLPVDVFGPDTWPVSTLLPEPAGRALQEALEAAGVHFHLDTTARRIDRRDGRYRIELQNGDAFEADLVMSAVGLRPDTGLAAAAGLTVGRGIVTDRLLHTSAPQVYALGDCAEVDGMNLPYVMPIMHAARALAKTLTGDPAPVRYPAMPVVIKTPSLATVVSPPPRHAAGAWEHAGSGRNIRSTFVSPSGELLGFALTGEAAAEKQALTKQLPAVL